MNNDIDKFFDPKTMPDPTMKLIPVDYFERIRLKLKLSFAFPDKPKRIFAWNDQSAQKLLFEFQSHGGKEILVVEKDYQERIKTLAKTTV